MLRAFSKFLSRLHAARGMVVLVGDEGGGIKAQCLGADLPRFQAFGQQRLLRPRKKSISRRWCCSFLAPPLPLLASPWGEPNNGKSWPGLPPCTAFWISMRRCSGHDVLRGFLLGTTPVRGDSLGQCFLPFPCTPLTCYVEGRPAAKRRGLDGRPAGGRGREDGCLGVVPCVLSH